LGGLPKKVSVLKKYSLRHPNHLMVDAGNLFFPTRVSQKKMATAKLRADIIARILLARQKVIFNIGYNDLVGGISFLQQLQQKYALNFLSANLTDKDKTLLFTPYVRQQVGSLSIAVIGLTGKQVPNSLKGEVRIAPWQKTLPPALDELGQTTDIIILLSSYSPQENQQITQTFDQIRVIIQAGRPKGNKIPRVIHNALLCQTTDRGQYQGVLTLNWGEQGKWAVKSNTKAQLKKIEQHLQQVASRLKQLEQITDQGPQHEQKVNKLRRLKEHLQIKRDKLAHQVNHPNTTGPTYQNHFIALTPGMDDDPETLQLLKDAGVL